MSFVSTRKAITVTATFVVALLVAFSTLLVGAAPSAQAASSTTVLTNAGAFNKAHTGNLQVRVVSKTGLSARVYMAGELVGEKPINGQQVRFTVSRVSIPNKAVTIAVRTYRNGEQIHVDKLKVRDHPKPKRSSSTSSGSKIVSAARAQVGDAYRLGATGMASWDCSGLTRYAVKKGTGKTIPRTSAAQKSAGKKISRASARPGDLVYTKGHIAVYAGNNRVVEAATPKTGVVYRKMWQSNPTFIRP